MNNKDVLKDCTGIAVVENNKVLLGLRQDGQGWGLAGGKREGNETLEECAHRELKEEFDLQAVELEFMGIVKSTANLKGREIIVQPSIYLCKNYLGEIRICKRELIKYQWVDLTSVLDWEGLFPPSRQGIKLVLKKLKDRGILHV